PGARVRTPRHRGASLRRAGGAGCRRARRDLSLRSGLQRKRAGDPRRAAGDRNPDRERRADLPHGRAGARARRREGRGGGEGGGGDGEHAESGDGMTSARRRARELALQGIYQWQYTGEGAAQVLKNLSELEGFGEADQKFLKAQLTGTIAESSDLRSRI